MCGFFVFGQALLIYIKRETRFAILLMGSLTCPGLKFAKYLSNKLFLQKHESIPLRKKLWDRYSMRVKIWASVAAWTGFNLSLEGPFSRGGP